MRKGDKVFYWQCLNCGLVLIQLIPSNIGNHDILDVYGTSYFQDDEKTSINSIMDMCRKCSNISLYVPLRCSKNQLIRKVKRYGCQERRYKIT